MTRNILRHSLKPRPRPKDVVLMHNKKYLFSIPEFMPEADRQE